MEHKDLQECIRSLAMMDETDSFLISCYLSLEKGAAGCRDFLRERELLLEKTAGILEIDAGSVTESLWMERPELRKRIGREWTKEH